MTKEKHTRRRNREERVWRNDLAQERRARRLSLEQASRILGIPLATLANYERGSYAPSLIAALKLQILYRGQVASFYDPLYTKLTEAIRTAEAEETSSRGAS